MKNRFIIGLITIFLTFGLALLGCDPDGSAPGVPVITRAEVGDRAANIKIFWGVVTNASGFYIYRSLEEAGTYNMVGTMAFPNSTSYFDEDLDDSTTYFYKVSAYNDKGESGLSNIFHATTFNGVPSPYEIIISDKTITSITISWDSVSNADGYNIYQYNSAVNIEKIATTIDTSYTIAGLQPDKKYSFRVSAINDAKGESQLTSINNISPDNPAGATKESAIRITGTFEDYSFHDEWDQMWFTYTFYFLQDIQWSFNIRDKAYNLNNYTGDVVVSVYTSNNQTVSINNVNQISIDLGNGIQRISAVGWNGTYYFLIKPKDDDAENKGNFAFKWEFL